MSGVVPVACESEHDRWRREAEAADPAVRYSAIDGYAKLGKGEDGGGTARLAGRQTDRQGRNEKYHKWPREGGQRRERGSFLPSPLPRQKRIREIGCTYFV